MTLPHPTERLSRAGAWSRGWYERAALVGRYLAEDETTLHQFAEITATLAGRGPRHRNHTAQWN